MNFNPFLRYRQAAYRKTFENPEGRKVLADLRRFCRATQPTADVNNVNATFLLEGRREVYLRILSHLHLTEEDVVQLVEDYAKD
jgi:hypothetical protein